MVDPTGMLLTSNFIHPASEGETALMALACVLVVDVQLTCPVIYGLRINGCLVSAKVWIIHNGIEIKWYITSICNIQNIIGRCLPGRLFLENEVGLSVISGAIIVEGGKII